MTDCLIRPLKVYHELSAKYLILLAAVDDVPLLAIGPEAAESFQGKVGTNLGVVADADVRVRTRIPITIATKKERTNGQLFGRHFVGERTSGHGARAAQETRANGDAGRIVDERA